MLTTVLLSGSFYLLKKLHDRLLSDTCTVFISLVIPWIIFSFIALHRECLSWASLSIDKDSSMVTFNDSIDKSWNSQPIINILLVHFGREYLIECIYLPPLHLWFGLILIIFIIALNNFNLFFATYLQPSTCLSLVFFMRQHWPYTYCNLYLWTSWSKATLWFLWTWRSRTFLGWNN